MWQKSKLGGGSLLAPARKFVMSFAPPLIVGAAIVQDYGNLAITKRCPQYACFVTGRRSCAAAFSVKVIPVMGWCFIMIGAVAFALPSIYGNLMMGLSFGGLHIVFGAIIARRYGG